MTPITDDDLFLGSWELQTELSDYELGQPPAEGLYRIGLDGDKYLFEIAWKTADGQRLETSYSGIADGRQHPFKDPQIADSVSLTRVDDLTLDSESFKGGIRIAHARRELIESGRVMRVIQSSQTPDGRTIRNVSYYHKLE